MSKRSGQLLAEENISFHRTLEHLGHTEEERAQEATVRWVRGPEAIEGPEATEGPSPGCPREEDFRARVQV